MDAAEGASSLQADSSFAGWDTDASLYWTLYILMAVGLISAAVMWKNFGQSGDWSGTLSLTFTTFCLLAGLNGGFGAMAKQMLAAMKEEGKPMEKNWFVEDSWWLMPYTLSLLLGALASSVCLGTAAAFAGLNPAWIRGAKCIGLVMGLVEVVLCFINIDHSGISGYWSIVAAIAGCSIVAVRGREAPGFPLCVAGYGVQLVGFAWCFAAPAICDRSRVVQTDAGPLYVKDTEHKANWFCGYRLETLHVCYALSIVLLLIGSLMKADRDREQSYLAMVRSAYGKDQPRCCGF
mmetsp:Transcript_71823/g.208093  ORF Transcript_71823/g.208093 Transcript_71823/m.208093 type:complete len:292 (-) Transcript_71823:142-1017(-)